MPGFHAIMVLRDEGDIIAQTLEHLLTWCDSLYIYDTGSLDDTWDIVNDFAVRDRRIIPVARESVLFDNGLRAWLFNRFRSRFRRGDWIARVDADEFYHITPPRFIQDRLRPGEGRICARLYDFIMTRRELKAWQDGRESVADRARPIEERRRYFRFDDYPEQRLFRYRRSVRWSSRHYDPHNGGLMAVERIPVRHYHARDPVQVQVRCAIRAAMAQATNANERHHWHKADWRHLIRPANAPRVLYWRLGSPLPDRPVFNHLPRAAMRAAQQIYYRSGLVKIRDRCRHPADGQYRPAALPAVVDERIRSYLAAISDPPFLRHTPLPVREARMEGSAHTLR